MIEERGRVVAVEDQLVVVETARKSSCQACSAKNTCGQGLKRQVSDRSASHMHIRAFCDFPVRVGDGVVIGIPESAVLRASFWVYLVPLLCLVATMALGQWLVWPESLLIVSSFLSLGAGFILTACRFRHDGQRQMQPVVLERLAGSQVFTAESVLAVR